MKMTLTLILCVFFSLAIAQDDPFAGRSASPGPDIASDKENLPVKKEKFADKLVRYKTEGFKVAVVLNTGMTTAKSVSGGPTQSDEKQIALGGSTSFSENDFLPLIKIFTDKMNETFTTDLFEIVDMKTIPYKESKFGKVDDWAITKYKMVIYYSISSIYDYRKTGIMTGEIRWKANYRANINAVATEFVNEKKGVKMRYPFRVGFLGGYSKELVTEVNPEIRTVDELNLLVSPLSGSELASYLQKKQDETIGKFLEKRKKK